MLKERRGSALLIVLGMLSFMVVSAVAFSVFMRQGRLPSSFLRQRILARQLVKAGLAQAMSDLDSAIGSAKYPSSRYTSSSNRNYWRNRVFMGVSNDDGPYEDEEDGLKNTVATMPLEGLAYIPPPLVNTVRYWSRRSPTAAWKPLDYDAGRWAYTAVNVSDYLDINSLKANAMRDSTPARRISLGYLFEEGQNHADWGTVKPSKFDAAMKTMSGSTYGPLVSLADYNLALSSDAGGPLAGIGFKSPFCAFIKSPPSGAEFYTDEEQARQQKFVTASWYPRENTQAGESSSAGAGTAGNVLFLTDAAKGQPFDGMNESLDDLQKDGSEAFKVFRERLDICTLGALYDYVDEDDVPISLAIPTLERAPVLTGIRLTPSDFAIVLDNPTKQTVPGGAAAGANPPKDDERLTWAIKSLGSNPKITFSACGVFPFKRKSGFSQKTTFDVEVHVSLFFADAGQAFEETRLADADLPYRPANGSWADSNTINDKGKGWQTLIGKAKATITPGALTDSQTTFDITGVEIPVNANLVQGKHVYGVLQKYKIDPNTGGAAPDPAVYDATDMTDPLLYRPKASGAPAAVTDGLKLKLCYACWVRILGDNGKTVDLVPARVSDDQGYNGFNSGTLSDYDKVCGAKAPLLPISSGILLELDLSKFSGTAGTSTAAATGADQGSLAIYCDDPRYNYAPEDWYASPNGDVQGSVWLAAAKSRCDGNDRRPFSIFQFVSDQDYLQSMGELQFLPYVTSFAKKQDPFSGTFFNSGKYDGRPFAQRTGPTDLANKDFAWKTHWGFGDYADHKRDGKDCSPYKWSPTRIEDTDGGAAVNPYADGDLFLAALANTPYDYIVAADNGGGKGENGEDEGMKLEDNDDLCFNARSGEAKLTWAQLQGIAAKIKQNFDSGLDWDDWDDWDRDDFFGQTLTNFDDVDRKFLFSYWKQCFANRQQLFLVFVRAEPTVIGGSSIGHTPSQLGARAVALVWREPVSTIDGQASGQRGQQADPSSEPPHRMRILFYHQFE